MSIITWPSVNVLLILIGALFFLAGLAGELNLGWVRLPATKGTAGWILAIVGFCVLVVGVLMSIFPSPVTDTPSGCPGGIFKIVSVATGKVLDISGRSPNDGAVIQQYDYAGQSNQQWQFVPVGNNWFKIVSVATGKVLDITNGSPNDGTVIQQYHDTGAASQHWQCISIGGDHFKILSQATGKVLDITDGSPNNRAVIEEYHDTGAASQQWQFVPVN